MIGRGLRLLLVVCALAAMSPPAFAQAPIAAFKTDRLAILGADGKRHEFKIELAVTPEERAQGLMFRKSLAPDAGMLFDFRVSAPVSMWMKNTFIPLDMLFIAQDGRIVNIAQRTVPHSLTTVPSQGPVRGVLELAGGTTARLGIKPGDRVQHAIFGTAPAAR